MKSRLMTVLVLVLLLAGCASSSSQSSSTGGKKAPASVPSECEIEFKKSPDVVPDEVLSKCLEQAAQTRTSFGYIVAPTYPTDSDKEIIGEYVDSLSYTVNKALRENNQTSLKKLKSKLARLDRGVSKFPIYRGIVFRGSDVSPQKELVKGAVYQDPAFMAASVDISIAERYTGPSGGYILVIFSKTGRRLVIGKNADELTDEKEVLIPRNRNFKIFDVKKESKKNLIWVYLVEQ